MGNKWYSKEKRKKKGMGNKQCLNRRLALSASPLLFDIGSKTSPLKDMFELLSLPISLAKQLIRNHDGQSGS